MHFLSQKTLRDIDPTKTNYLPLYDRVKEFTTAISVATIWIIWKKNLVGLKSVFE